MTLPAGVDRKTLNQIVERLEKKKYHVAEIDDLQSGGTILDEDK